MAESYKSSHSHPEQFVPLKPVDYSREDWASRVIVRVFDWIIAVLDRAIRMSPTYKMAEMEMGELTKELAEWDADLRRRFPERMAQADRDMESKYDYLKHLR
jgi:acyl carrier protein phosphodiesterase